MKNEQEDSTCLNCGDKIEKYYCPSCGQEKESHHRFHHLFTHFVYDFVHYDHSLWKTLKVLFFSPGKLTTEYLKGRRRTYVSPFSLYIFISIICFFIISFIPFTKAVEERLEVDDIFEMNINTTEDLKDFFRRHSIENGTAEKDMYTAENVVVFSQKYKESTQNTSQFISSFSNNLPKFMFIYMPLFALWLWLLNLRRKPGFFDNGVFTLNFFSYLLITITIYSVVLYFSIKYGVDAFGISIITGTLLTYHVIYFIWSCKVFYQSNIFIILFKSVILFSINVILFSTILVFYIMIIGGELF